MKKKVIFFNIAFNTIIFNDHHYLTFLFIGLVHYFNERQSIIISRKFIKLSLQKSAKAFVAVLKIKRI
jgi:hypothetical protein